MRAARFTKEDFRAAARYMASGRTLNEFCAIFGMNYDAFKSAYYHDKAGMLEQRKKPAPVTPQLPQDDRQQKRAERIARLKRQIDETLAFAGHAPIYGGRP